MDSLWLDLRYSFRRLRQAPGFAAIAILIVALGIGANSAIFSLVNAVLFRPQPYDQPEELVNVYVSDSRGEQHVTTSRFEFRTFREQSDLFAGTAAFETQFLSRETSNGSGVAIVEAVSANYWDVLGVRLHRGRGFLAEEELGGPVVAVINYQTWQREFGGDEGLVGRTVRLNGAPVTIVGIAPSKYRGVVGALITQYWLPFGSFNALAPGQATDLADRGSRGTWVRARLLPGVTVARAQAGLDLVMSRLGREFPQSNEGRTALVAPAAGIRFHPAVDGALYPVAAALLLVVGLVLAIACSNIAGLMLARASTRRKEVALRLAVGAGRARLVRQLLTESVLVAAIGGAFGLALAWVMVRALVAFQPPIPVPLTLDLTLDGRVLAFTAVLSLGTGLLFGLAPALRSTRTDLVGSLKDDDAGLAGRHRWFGLRNVLVVVQVAVSVLLLAGAGLFVRSLGNAQGVDPGFETDQAAILTVSLGHGELSEAMQRETLRTYVDRVRRLPGVLNAAVADRVPLSVAVRTREVVIDGYEMAPGEESVEVDYVAVGPGYFETLRIPLLRGRDFAASDGPSARPVAIVSEAMAKKYWNRIDVVGEQIRAGPNGEQLIEIVGVARDTKVRTLGETPRPYFYAAVDQEFSDLVGVVVATAGDPGPALEAMRRELASVAPDVPVFDAKTMPQQLGVALFLPRIAATLLGVFGALGLALAGLGLYGVVAFAVAQRTREIGIRMALGADSSEVVKLVVRESVGLVAVGLAIGIVLALVATRPLAGVLYGVAPGDLVTLAGVSGVLGVAAVVASVIPARRAVSVDPLLALRSQ